MAAIILVQKVSFSVFHRYLEEKTHHHTWNFSYPQLFWLSRRRRKNRKQQRYDLVALFRKHVCRINERLFFCNPEQLVVYPKTSWEYLWNSCKVVLTNPNFGVCAMYVMNECSVILNLRIPYSLDPQVVVDMIKGFTSPCPVSLSGHK